MAKYRMLNWEETFFDGIVIVTFRITRKCNNLHRKDVLYFLFTLSTLTKISLQ